MTRIKKFVIKAAIGGCFLGGVLGQSRSQQLSWNKKIEQFGFTSSLGIDHGVGPGDLLEIHVLGVEELHQLERVNAQGEITVAHLGSLKVAGRTVADLEELISNGLERKELVVNPQVSVTIKEYRSQPVFVLGAVNTPGQYQVTGPLTLIEALALAGGIDEGKAAGHVLLRRAKSKGGPEGTKPEIIRVKLSALLEGQEAQENVAILGGDTINVPMRVVQMFYLIGDVNQPGAYEFPASGELHLTQALAWAGGAMKTAKSAKSILFRYEEAGQREQIPINVKRILEGKEDDWLIRPEDVIFVPGSASKNILYSMMGIIPRTVSGTIVRVPENH